MSIVITGASGQPRPSRRHGRPRRRGPVRRRPLMRHPSAGSSDLGRARRRRPRRRLHRSGLAGAGVRRRHAGPRHQRRHGSAPRVPGHKGGDRRRRGRRRRVDRLHVRRQPVGLQPDRPSWASTARPRSTLRGAERAGRCYATATTRRPALGGRPSRPRHRPALFSNEGRRPRPTHPRADCAADAAAVLLAGGHDGKEYDVTGPEALGATDVAGLYAEVGVPPGRGRAGRRRRRTTAAWSSTPACPSPSRRTYTTFGTGARRATPRPVSTTVADLTGRQPTSARDVLAAANRAVLEGG